MSRPVAPVVDFYSRHPISEGQIIDALHRQGKDLKRLVPEDLYAFDQDHYGGLEAVEALGRRAGIDASSRVLDVCAGLAGPARFMARRWGARVTGVDLNPDRAAGAPVSPPRWDWAPSCAWFAAMPRSSRSGAKRSRRW